MGTFNEFIDIFEDLLLTERELSKITLQFYSHKIKHIRKHLGQYDIDDISRKEISAFIMMYPPRSSNQFRGLLIDIYNHAVAMGYAILNPARGTLKRRHRKQRQRLTLEGYMAIYYIAPNWLKNAMDIALQTLQRVSDVCKMKFTDIQDGALIVIQGKSKKVIKIKMRPQLEEIIYRCRDDIASPYIIHRLPERLAEQNLRLVNRTHPTQILRDYCTKSFSAARDKCGYFNYIPINERPTFHEIRSLGAFLYEKQQEFPQNLLGHEDKAMTEYYLNGHDRQIEVEAGLVYNPHLLPG